MTVKNSSCLLVLPALSFGYGLGHPRRGSPPFFRRLMQVSGGQILPTFAQKLPGLPRKIRNGVLVLV